MFQISKKINKIMPSKLHYFVGGYRGYVFDARSPVITNISGKNETSLTPCLFWRW
jgi:hypothetical protein